MSNLFWLFVLPFDILASLFFLIGSVAGIANLWDHRGGPKQEWVGLTIFILNTIAFLVASGLGAFVGIAWHTIALLAQIFGAIGIGAVTLYSLNRASTTRKIDDVIGSLYWILFLIPATVAIVAYR